MEGLIKILAIRASMNWGLTRELKAAFPSIITVKRPIILNYKIPYTNWLAVFTSAEGSLMVKIKGSKTITGYAVQLEFQLTQHCRDLNLIKSFTKYFDCGYISIVKTRPNEVNFRVTKFKNITQNIIPFSQKYPIIVIKSKDFYDFCRVAEMMKEKKHLTAKGLKQIHQIKAGMNRGRNIF